jgi:L-2-hydroxyglutarate oxidase
MPSIKTYDLVIVGGGIVGLASAWRILQAHPGLRLAVVEKEPTLASHQTGRNSGVIHSGIYYKPGSYKASLCLQGYAELLDFAREYGVAHDICGKVIVATEEAELPRLTALKERAEQNGLMGIEELDPRALREIEPESTGLAALRVPQTGIIDYPAVCERLADQIRALGGEIRLGERVIGISGRRGDKGLRTSKDALRGAFLLNCGGVYSDKLARLEGVDPGMSIIPFRGEYYALKAGAPPLVRHLIYPVPDPAFPFLGVHFTRMIAGGTECGPNAVLALGRESYGKFQVNIPETFEIFANPGFRALATKHWRMGLMEMRRSLSKALFTAALQRLVPRVTAPMLEPIDAGIRAQAMRNDGTLVDDFAFAEGDGSLHVLNAPSPAATASLAIGSRIADRYATLR